MPLKKGLTEKAYTNASLKASALPYYASETSWSARLFWRCAYVHAGLYRFLNAPLADRCTVIP